MTSLQRKQMWRFMCVWIVCMGSSVSLCTAQDEPVPSTPADQAPLAGPPSLPAVAHPPGVSSFRDESSFAGEEAATKEIEVRFMVERPVTEQVQFRGKKTTVTRYSCEMRAVKVAVDADLSEVDLPPDGKRAVVLAVTAARHDDLLRDLKEAKNDEEKKAAIEALKTNYTTHYAIETWWREERLADLEERLKEMRAQVQQRQDAEEKYVTAAMTIAELWADGIAIAPPKPGRTPNGVSAPTIVGGASIAPVQGAPLQTAPAALESGPTRLPFLTPPQPSDPAAARNPSLYPKM